MGSPSILGISMGIAMAMMRDHAIMPAHAHLNLLGWVSLFLFGVYYHLNPSLDSSRLALVQVSVWCLGTIVLTVAVAVCSPLALTHPVSWLQRQTAHP